MFFAPKNLRAGGYWQPVLAQEIANAMAFLLIVGEKGVGPWQVLEYYEALDKRVKSPSPGRAGAARRPAGARGSLSCASCIGFTPPIPHPSGP